MNADEQKNQLLWYFCGSLLISQITCCIRMLIEYAQEKITNQSLDGVHDMVLTKIMHAPVNLYFDVTPKSRVLKYLQEYIHSISPEFISNIIGLF